jgi:predicted dehydrogenase
MDRPVGLGLVGCGAFGAFCLEAFSRLDAVRIAAVADVRKDAADALGGRFGVPAFGDPEGLIACDDVDLVHIATPPSTHYELLLAAAAAGKHALVEKPLALTVAHADEMLSAASRAGTIAPVNFVLRYNAITQATKAVIDSSVLGQVLSARLTNCAADSNLPPGHWFWDRGLSGGIFLEHAVHFFDLYRHLLGDGRVIAAHTETREGTDQQDRVTCLVRHESGALASHYHGFDQIGPMDRTTHHLVCESGDMRLSEWIPLTLEVNAAVDEQGLAILSECCPGCRIEVLETYEADRTTVLGRGKQRHVTQRVRLTFRPNEDKQAVYADSVRALLTDQISYLRDRSHARRVSESNGREAVALAEAAAKLAARNG